MSSTTSTIETAAHAHREQAETTYRFVDWGMFLKVILGIAAVYTLVRVYMHEYAYTVGLDYFEPEFAAYWMPLLYAELVAATAGLLGVSVYLWRTRDRDLANLPPEVELQRYFKLIAWLTGYTFVVLLTGSVGGEADAAWHQVVIRDTDFTPTHIILFYLLVPTLIIFGIGSFLYASTRLPEFSNRFLLSLCVAIGGPILIMPNVGLNEWGHTFFYAEELFAAPIHWGFALLGLALLALGGVVVHIIARCKDLVDQVGANARA
ncbi:MAG: methane monooxygenase/ammonia monooxygenase subunit C [Gammaproteobacteria bacterium]